MTIGDIAPKINSPQAETHCLNSNDIPNNEVKYIIKIIGKTNNSINRTSKHLFKIFINNPPHYTYSSTI